MKKNDNKLKKSFLNYAKNNFYLIFFIPFYYLICWCMSVFFVKNPGEVTSFMFLFTRLLWSLPIYILIIILLYIRLIKRKNDTNNIFTLIIYIFLSFFLFISFKNMFNYEKIILDLKSTYFFIEPSNLNIKNNTNKITDKISNEIYYSSAFIYKNESGANVSIVKISDSSLPDSYLIRIENTNTDLDNTIFRGFNYDRNKYYRDGDIRTYINNLSYTDYIIKTKIYTQVYPLIFGSFGNDVIPHIKLNIPNSNKYIELYYDKKTSLKGCEIKHNCSEYMFKEFNSVANQKKLSSFNHIDKNIFKRMFQKNIESIGNFEVNEKLPTSSDTQSDLSIGCGKKIFISYEIENFQNENFENVDILSKIDNCSRAAEDIISECYNSKSFKKEIQENIDYFICVQSSKKFDVANNFKHEKTIYFSVNSDYGLDFAKYIENNIGFK